MRSTVATIGFWAGLFAVAATISYSVVQIMQLAGILTYPMDEQLIYGTSLCIVIPLLIEMLALHHTTPGRNRFWSHTALTFATLYAVFVTANYVVQLVTVIPMTMKDRLDEVRILQENESTFIPVGTRHRLANPGKVPLELVEVQCGAYLGEDDIVRFEDVYGRVGSDVKVTKNS